MNRGYPASRTAGKTIGSDRSDADKRPALVSTAGLRLAGARALPVCVFVVLPLLAAWIYLSPYIDQHVLGLDFKGTLWGPARAILDGRNPYPDASLAQITSGTAAVYPPTAMLLVVPLALLPWGLAAAVWAVALVGAIALALRLLDVSDWRCYVVALASTPVLMGVALGNLSLALVPLTALAWRYRDRLMVSGSVVAVLVAAKLFLWPLLLWLLLTRRFRAAAVGAVGGVILLLASWAVIGLAGLRDYPQLVRSLDGLYAAHSYSLTTLGHALGLRSAAWVLMLVAVAAVAVSALRVGRSRNGDGSLFCLAILASLAVTPVLWPHTMALLLVAIAVLSPRLGWLWFTPLLLWVGEAIGGGKAAGSVCCRPEGTSEFAWATMSGSSALAPSLAAAILLGSVLVAVVLEDDRVRLGVGL